MKVMLVNGGPHEKGCTYTALAEIEKVLTEEGIESEIFWLGNRPIGGCISCGGCKGTGRCVFDSDPVNRFLDRAGEFDGFIFGSPVHYAGATGAITSFLDRVFYANSSLFAFKPAAAVVSARRGGTTASWDQLNKYFGITQMPIITSQYWNMVHGNTAQQVLEDKEGLQTMRVLARNMAWFLRCKEAGEKAGVPLPKQEERAITNFIR